MRCIFCKKDSDKSKSIEHIVPEYLGNKKHVLAPGVVCDKCNQYFCIKIEKPLLEQPYFKSLRFRNSIESKKGKYPIEKGRLPNSTAPAYIQRGKDNLLSIVIEDTEAFKAIASGMTKELYFPFLPMPENPNKELSKLLGKISIEVFVQNLLASKYADTIDEFIDEEQFDFLRNYVRYGQGIDYWEFHVRKIYGEDNGYYYGKTVEDLLFEYDFLYTVERELYFCIAIKGIEYVLNMAGSSLEGYQRWLRNNNYISPLYTPKNL